MMAVSEANDTGIPSGLIPDQAGRYGPGRDDTIGNAADDEIITTAAGVVRAAIRCGIG